MADDDILVSIAANIEQLLAGFNKAAEDVGSSLGTIETHVSNASASLQEKLAPAAEHAAESLQHIHETSEGVGGALSELKEKFATAMEVTGIALAYEALEKVKEMLDELSERAIEFGHLGESLGIGAVAMQGLEAAANEAGVSTSRLERVMFMLTQRMENAQQNGGALAQKFNDLGISNEMLGDTSLSVIDAMAALGSEANSNAQLIALLGARSAIVIPILREMAKNHELVGEAAQKVNALLPSEIAQMGEYHAMVATATEQFENWSSRIVISLIPALQEMLNEFKELITVGPVMQEVLDGIGFAIKSIVMVAVELAYGFKGAFDVILNSLNLLISPIAAVGAAMTAMAHGNFSEAKDILVMGFKDVGTNWNRIWDDFNADADKGDAAIARMRVALSGLSEVHPNLEREEMPEQKPVGKEDDKTYLNNMKERAKLHEAMIKQEMKDDDEYLSQQVKNADEGARATLDATLGGIQQQMMQLQDLAKTHQISWMEELAGEKKLIGDKLAAQMAYYAQVKSLAAAQGRDTSKLDEEEVKAASNAATQIVAAQTKAADQVRQTWDRNLRPIASSFNENITRMIEGTESFGQAWRNITASILDTFIKMIVNMMVQWLLGMLENLIIGKTVGNAQIATNAAVAATAAMGSVAAIPMIGWAMAPEIGAETYFDAMSYSLSAAKGFDIPAGMNPVTQLHEKEMVLPANIADPLRQMIAGGGGGGGRINLNVSHADDNHFFVKKKDLVAAINDANSRHSFGTNTNFRGS